MSDSFLSLFHKILKIYSIIHQITHMLIGSFYWKYVTQLPSSEMPTKILHNPKFFPYFKNCRGCIDGSHIKSWVPEEAAIRYRNRKGFISQNVLAACDFDMCFIYLMSRWEGSAADSHVFENARILGLSLDEGNFYLADAGFPLCNMLLIPYWGVRYHLKEWSQDNQK